MVESKRKILFCGIDQKYIDVINNHLYGVPYVFDFCSLNDTAETIISFKPDILITAITSSLSVHKNQVFQLKSISSSSGIQYAVVVNKSKIEPYQFLISNQITNIITSPINRQDFIAYINKYLCIEDSDVSADNDRDLSDESSCNEAEDSLISNLVTQNKMLKDYLKKNQHHHDEFEKMHFEKVNEHRTVENRLWEAYENGYFRLYYQPVISLESGKLAGFEALIRIIHPDDGLISPAEFRDIAEKSAIIFPV